MCVRTEKLRDSGNQPLSFLVRQVVTSRCHGSKVTGSQQTVALQIWRTKKNEKIEIHDFPFMIAVKYKAVVHAYLASFDNANSRLCQERLFRSGNFATMVT